MMELELEEGGGGGRGEGVELRRDEQKWLFYWFFPPSFVPVGNPQLGYKVGFYSGGTNQD